MRVTQDDPARLIHGSHVRLVNCSAAGCLLETAHPLPVNTVATLRVSFAGSSLEDVVQVVRCEAFSQDGSIHHVATRFLSVAGPYVGSVRYLMRHRIGELAGSLLDPEADERFSIDPLAAIDGETDISRPVLKLFWAGPEKPPPVSRTTWFFREPGRRDDCDQPGRLLDMDTRPLTDLLIAGQNADGGWGYYRHKQSRLEPTCWAVLALVRTGRDGASVGEALRRWPVRDGLLLERAGGEPNHAFHALALLALRAAALEHRDGNLALFNGLQRVKGLALEPSEINRQDNSIQGWSWIDDTFSWVEPTAWCLLALKSCVAAAGVSL